MRYNSYPNTIGVSPQKFYPVISVNDRSIERRILSKVWNTYQLTSNNSMGGFRSVMNAGDHLSRVNMPCSGSNQVTSRPGMLHLTTKDGLIRCNNTYPVANTNVKYVYDSSDFTRYRKEKSINAGYGDKRTLDYDYGGSGVPIGRGRTFNIGGRNSYGTGSGHSNTYNIIA